MKKLVCTIRRLSLMTLLISATGAHAAVWTPADITTALWFDASDTNTVTPSTGGDVTLWRDKSGHNRDATALTGNVAYTSGRYMYFNKVNMAVANPFTPSNPQVFAVMQNAGANKINYFLGSEDAGFYSGGFFKGFAGFGLYDGTAQSGSTNAYDPNLNLLSIDKNSVYRNGTTLTMGHTSAGTVLISRLGGRTSVNTDVRFAGRIHEIIVVDGELSLENRQKMEGYLAHKWALADNLPAEHPYKYQPPPPLFTGTMILVY